MSTAIATIEQAGVQVDHQAILKTLNLNPRDPNTQALLLVCERYGLDPLLKHMVLISGNPYITRDGYLAIAHRSGVFDGMEVLEQGADTTHHIAKVAVYRKDMGRPFTFIGRYPKAQRMAKDYGPEMAVKVAEVQALRRAFNVTGVGAADERWDEEATRVEPASDPEPSPTEPPGGSMAQVRGAMTHLRTREDAQVVDTPELPPSTGTRRRKPPTAAPQEPADEQDPPASEQQIAEIARRLESLIPADKPKAMAQWIERGLPGFYVPPAADKNVNPEFTAVHAASALALLVGFGGQPQQPTLDGGEAA